MSYMKPRLQRTLLLTMGVTLTAYHPITQEVLELLEEEMVPWEFWRP